MAELIAFNKNEKLEYEGFCKLTINACSNLLLIEPKNEDYKMISSLFTWKYTAEKNILFIFGEHFSQDFALIFNNENKCKKVFNILIEKKANIGTTELIHKRFLPKLFEVISIKNDRKLGKILVNWINKCVMQKNENGKECFKINRAEHQCHPRKYNPEKFSGEIIVKKPMYKIIEEKVMGKSQTKLLVFISKDQKFCYKFNIKEPGVFYCIKCRKMKQYLRASLLKDEEENEFIAVRNKKHLCEPIEYLQIDFEEKKIVKLPNYKIIEKRNGKNSTPYWEIPLDQSIIDKYGVNPVKQRISDMLCNLSPKEIRHLANTVECGYCRNLFNGPNESMNNHLIKKRCPQTSDPPALRKTTELTAQIRRFLNSKFFLADDVLFLMLNGMNDEDKAIFLDGLIICGKQFDTSNPSLEVPLSLCRLYSDEPPVLRSQNESIDIPPDDYIYFKYGFVAREQKIVNKIASFTDQEIRNLGNCVQCPYCHRLFNGPYVNYHQHLIRHKCAKTDDDCPERLLQQLNSYAWKHMYSNSYIHDDELNLMINGLSERSISIFLDALIVGGKVFNISNEQIQSSLPLCRYIS